MFKEQYGKKIFTTVSLLSLPPKIEGFTAVILISIINPFINEIDNSMQRVNKLRLIWIIDLIFFVVTMIFSFFLKGNKV